MIQLTRRYPTPRIDHARQEALQSIRDQKTRTSNVASEGYVGRTTILALRRHALRRIRRGDDIYVANRHLSIVRLGRVCVCMYEAQLLHAAHRLSNNL